MVEKSSRKRLAVAAFACIAILIIGVVWYFYGQRIPHPDLLPENSEKETLLHDISYEEGFAFPGETSMQIYRNRADDEDSLSRAAIFLDLEESDFIFREKSAATMFDVYDVPGGTCEIEKATGYWRYTSDEADKTPGKTRSEFFPDEEIARAAEEFLRERGIFEDGEYTVAIGEVTQGNGDAGELVTGKDAYIYPLVGGHETLGVYRLILSFDAEGEITEIASYYNPPEEYKSVKLKDEQAAKELLQEGRYSVNTVEPLYDVTVEKAALAYYSDADPEKGHFLLYPVYVFSGTGRAGGSGERVSFEAVVDAIRD